MTTGGGAQRLPEQTATSWEPVFSRDKTRSVCPEIMLKQIDESVI
jgi:hypothetical protein